LFGKITRTFFIKKNANIIAKKPEAIRKRGSWVDSMTNASKAKGHKRKKRKAKIGFPFSITLFRIRVIIKFLRD
jgi:hypothetical protein